MRNRVLLLPSLALALPLVLGACGGLYLLPNRARGGVRSPGVARDTLHTLQGRGTADAVYKMVVAKQPPSTLIADDGSWCGVDEETYAATKLREKVRCEWSR